MLEMNFETNINNINYIQYMQQQEKERQQLEKVNVEAEKHLKWEKPTKKESVRENIKNS